MSTESASVSYHRVFTKMPTYCIHDCHTRLICNKSKQEHCCDWSLWRGYGDWHQKFSDRANAPPYNFVCIEINSAGEDYSPSHNTKFTSPSHQPPHRLPPRRPPPHRPPPSYRQASYLPYGADIAPSARSCYRAVCHLLIYLLYGHYLLLLR